MSNIGNNINAQQYRSFLENGMLSSKAPLEHLPPCYTQWEHLLKQAQGIVRFSEAKTKEQKVHQDMRMGQWRQRVRQVSLMFVEEMVHGVDSQFRQWCIPAFSSSISSTSLAKFRSLESFPLTFVKMDILPLQIEAVSKAVVQRAHHVLAFLVQFYVQTLSEEARKSGNVIKIPAPIAIPLVAASRYLGIAPIVTYADTVLWNWKLIDARQPISVTNVRIIDLFTGNPQEEHFFLTSLKMEICGKTSVQAMLDVVMSRYEDAETTKLLYSLRKIASNLDELTKIFCDVRHGIKPEFFYNEFRPVSQLLQLL